MAKIRNNWHACPAKEILNMLRTQKSGLAKDDAAHRLERCGFNELPREKGLSGLKVFLAQFKGPLIIILLVAAGISLVIREFVDFGVIIAAVFLNTVIGFVQEYKANKSLKRLKEMIEPQATVRRDGREIIIPSREVVAGDILILEAGARIPADCRLIEAYDFSTNEAALTGESLPINKIITPLSAGTLLAERRNMAYLSTVAVRGRAVAVAVATGRETELGRIAKMISEIPEEPTPLQVQLSFLGKSLGGIVSIISLLIFIFGVILGQPWFGMLLTSVALSVAAIPEGLLVAMTVVLAIGMQSILKKQALTRRLITAETLGSVSVICSDKTGTLTLGVMQVTTVETYKGALELPSEIEGNMFAKSDHAIALKIVLLCNDAHFENPDQPVTSTIIGDPTEVALFRAARESGLDIHELARSYVRKFELPFDAGKRYMATRHEFKKDADVIYVKGAPEQVLSFCSYYLADGEIHHLGKDERDKIHKDVLRLAGKGLRILAAAYRRHDPEDPDLGENDLKEMVFTALVGLQDPVRPEARETIRLCREAGIRPVIVTGDHILTATAVAEQVGIEIKHDNAMNGAEIDRMNDRELAKVIKRVDIFARVEPQHKVRIVDAWQAAGAVVAMTGDGVNDAPALKSADVGVALGSGTDVAKENSDLVLLDDNYRTIVNAVHRGRIIFDNIRKIIVYHLADSFGEMILIVGSLIFRLPLPLLPAQILWINLITDGLPSFALTVEPGEKDVMRIPPRPRTEPVMNREMKLLIFLVGILTDIGLFLLFIYMLNIGKEVDYARTIVFAALGVDSLFYVFSCRSLRHTIFTFNPFSNRFLLAAVVGGLALQLVALYVPFFQNLFGLQVLYFKDWLLVLAIGVIEILAIEITKLFFIAARKRKQPACAI
ncbi:MAG: HAD-IC family P-type ATPase [Patescibacteria group bacterium]|nr:HAD-IC family P-type ATPase [Patescibacteria group bacterium]